jgi:outer membrane protein TolC
MVSNFANYWTDRSARITGSMGHRILGALLGAMLLGSAGTPAPLAAAQRRQMLLSLREATAFALQENLNIQIAGLNPQIREGQVTEEQGIFDVRVKGEFAALRSTQLETSSRFRERVADGFIGQDNRKEQELSAGVEQLTPYGGTYEVNILSDHFTTTETTSQTVRLLELEAQEGNLDDLTPRSKFYDNAIEFRITQPILQNFGAVVTKNQILIAQNNLKSSHEGFRQEVIGVTSLVQQTYWELVFRRQDLEVRRQQLGLNQRLLEQVRKQVTVGTLAPIEVLQTEADIASTRESIIVAENAVRNAEDRLKRVMNFSLTGDLADVEIVPTDPPAYTPIDINQTDQNRQALEERPELRQAKLTLANQNITLVVAKNRVLPTLDLEASLRYNGIDRAFGDSFDQFGTSRYRWQVGLAFSYPLANRQAKGRLQQAGLAIRQQMLRIKNLEENIIAEVRAAVRDIRTNAQRVRAARSSSRLAQRQLEAEEKKLRVGLATVFTVLDFQERLAAERSNEINALTEYMKALVRLEEVKGTLLKSYNIILQPAGPRLQ